ncbi:unnamed protein product, partial [Ilex paraguariensis]
GDEIYGVFDNFQLLWKSSHWVIIFRQIMSEQMLQRQTIDPDQGCGRLIKGSVGFFESPTEVSVNTTTF